MKTLIGLASSVGGAGALLLGSLFLLAAAGKTSRYVFAACALAGGALLLGLGVRLIKGGRRAAPERLRAELLALARSSDGELSATQIAAAFGALTVAAERELDGLIAAGVCRRETRNSAQYYTFAELQPRLLVARCEHCDAELPLSAQPDTCPRCGGVVQTRRERRPLDTDSVYSMDE